MPLPRRGRDAEAGYALAALVAMVTVMLVLMGAAAPTWRYVMKDDREEELLFRGGQIADAIARFQKKSGNALPGSLEVLVKGKHLRKLYKDPMTPKGEWRLLGRGETPVPGASPSPGFGRRGPGRRGGPSEGPDSPPAPAEGDSRPELGGGRGRLGGFIGVASTSTEKSLRLFNGFDTYAKWFFVAGQPRVVGRPPVPAPRSPGRLFPGGPREEPPGERGGPRQRQPQRP